MSDDTRGRSQEVFSINHSALFPVTVTEILHLARQMSAQYKTHISKILLQVDMTTRLGPGIQAEMELPASRKVSLKSRLVLPSPSLLWMQIQGWQPCTSKTLTQEEALGSPT